MIPLPDICVVGTDTGVGKTVVSLLLMQWLHGRGYDPFYLKPFQTGCAAPYDVDSDAAFVYRYTRELAQKDPAQSVIYCFPNPKAPYFAARDAGVSIDMEKVSKAIEKRRSDHSPLVVEAAGGLLVPVTGNQAIIDLLPHIGCRPLLVARAGLGTINHTLLSIEAMQNRDLTPFGVLLVRSGETLDDPAMVKENMAAIESSSGVQVGGVIQSISDFSAPPAEAYNPLNTILG